MLLCLHFTVEDALHAVLEMGAVPGPAAPSVQLPPRLFLLPGSWGLREGSGDGACQCTHPKPWEQTQLQGGALALRAGPGIWRGAQGGSG